ncbi:MAG: DUF2934 domain-containing protein [Candidatus Omnitrophica bacterium]|nr:DUF2934 domain-containing protein [Candidatus Omnitrophota bacterium]
MARKLTRTENRRRSTRIRTAAQEAAAAGAIKETTLGLPAGNIPGEDCIRTRAYFIWREKGCPEQGALDHWLAAEDECVLAPKDNNN